MKLLLCIFYIMATPSLLSAPLIIAHRGASGYEPENTLRSFKRALDMGAPMIELDVHVCKSGELVVIHDNTINRTTQGKGQVMQLTWDTLKKYNAGKGEHIPLLSEVFDLVGNGIIIDIELKGPHTAQPVAKLINDYVHNKKWSYDNFIVSSFDRHAVQEFHTYCPLVKTGIIFEKGSIESINLIKQAESKYAIIDYKAITQEFVDTAHARDIKVFAYTVNSKPIAQQLIQLNIDGIITNYPDILS